MRKLSVPLVLVACAAGTASWLAWSTIAQGGQSVWQELEVATEDASGEVFSWDSIEPSPELDWKLCYGAFQCTKLEVPLDYDDPDGRNASIAIIRKPALVPRTSSYYKGPVLFNPGGPGGSGVDLVLQLGNAFATILGPRFDIVGFDPRGISRSSPRANFFTTDVERALFTANNGRGLPVFQNETLAEQLIHPWAVGQLVGAMAAAKDDGYLKHLNTANTATDMLRIVQAHGREKLQYWGFSYGSILGATFAAMYPDNIERLVIDGVMDADDYYATGWLTNLVDTEKELTKFFSNCVEAGPRLCAFHSPHAEHIRQKLKDLYIKYHKQPLAIQSIATHGIVDDTTIRKAVFASLYSPHTSWVLLANALKQLSLGNGLPILAMTQELPYVCSCNPKAHENDNVWDSGLAVMCNDGDAVPSGMEDVTAYFEQLLGVSEWADQWGIIRLGCINWPNKLKSFRGPFNTTTSFPLLVVGNTADPVTPLRSAQKMARGFPGAALITQDSTGHCSVSNPSVCTQTHIRRYFQDGTLPPPGTICQPINGNPFKRLPTRRRQSGESQVPLQVLEDDEDLWEAAQEISEKFTPVLRPPF